MADVTPEATARLMRTLACMMQDSRVTLRREAAKQLSELNDECALDLLLIALGDANDEVRRQACIGLKQLRDPRSIFPLRELYVDPGDRHTVLDEALDALRAVGLNALDSLADELQGEDLDRVNRTVLVLGHLPHPKSVELLFNALHHHDLGIVCSACYGLADLDDGAIRQRLLSELNAPDVAQRTDAALALSFMGESRAYETLVAALRDGDASERVRAAHGLGRLRDRRCITSLIGALADEEEEVRLEALETLYALSFEGALHEAVGPLVRASLLDDRAAVRDRAAFMLRAFGLREVIRRSEATASLLQVLDESEETNPRIHAARALGMSGDPTAIESLVRVLQRDPSPRLRETAALALKEMHDSQAAPALRAAADCDDDLDVRDAAHRAWLSLIAE